MSKIQSVESQSMTAVPVSSRVLEAVAAADGTDPLEFETPLYEVVDTDALDTLCGIRGGATVEFDYLGYRVTVRGDGDISVTGPDN